MTAHLKTSITFVLPGSLQTPVGGGRIVYEYANRLAQAGHNVHVVHSPVTRIDIDWKMVAKAIVRYPQRLLDRSFRPDSWMPVDRRVNVHWTPTLHGRHVPDADVVIATAWKTAEWVAQYGRRKGRKFYFIQHFESWDSSHERVEATWKLPLRKIVIARWLQKMAHEMGETADYVPNAIDTEQFYCEKPIHERKATRVAMLYHTLKWKGCDDGLTAILQVKARHPNLEAELYGVPPRPKSLPDWIAYRRNPPQAELRAIYNRAAIFVAPSWAEGWSLTTHEAAVCGAAICATDIEGYRPVVIPNETALVSPAMLPEALAHNIDQLINDPGAS